jgi:hypothetical protein
MGKLVVIAGVTLAILSVLLLGTCLGWGIYGNYHERTGGPHPCRQERLVDPDRPCLPHQGGNITHHRHVRS